MPTSVDLTDEQVAELAATVQPCSVVVLRWGPQRHREGAQEIERAHQRRILGLHASGVISVLCPSAGSDTLAGVAVMGCSTEEAATIIGGDPCVQAGMIVADVQACVAFPGDRVPV